MKRTILWLIILTLVLPAFAMADNAKKIKTGNLFFGAGTSLGFEAGTDTQSDENGKKLESSDLGFDLALMMGYFLIDGIELGPKLGLAYNRRTDKDRQVTANTTAITTTRDITTTDLLYEAGLQFAYFIDTEGIVVPYILVGAAYLGGNAIWDNEIEEITLTVSGFTAGPEVGINIFFTRSIATNIGAFFDYSSGTRSADSDAQSAQKIENDFSTMDFGIQVGINVFF
jgi:opacity protein-like surface antigen